MADSIQVATVLAPLFRKSWQRLQLSDIQKTALFALVMRAEEAARAMPRIHDAAALQIVDALELSFDDLVRQLNIDMGKYDAFLSHEAVVARTIMFGEALRALIEQHPDATCINLGCGLDDKFSQVDNGVIRWIDIDLPDQISLRRRFFEDQDRCVMVCGDALDDAWTKYVPKDHVVIVCMEGVLEYFSQEQTSTCLRMLCDSFARGYLVAEMNSMDAVEHAKQHDGSPGSKVPLKWGTQSGQEFTALEPRLTLLTERSFNEEMRKHSDRGAAFADSPNRNLNNRIAIFSWG